MFALSKSILKPTGEYRVETFHLFLHDFDEEIRIELKIFGEEIYIGEYYVMHDEQEEMSGACIRHKTKEDTLLAVEEAVIAALRKKHSKKGSSS